MSGPSDRASSLHLPGGLKDEVVVQHCIRQYIDRLADPITDQRLCAKTVRARIGKKLLMSLMGRRVSFPRKLYELLSDATTDDFDHIVAWRSHGRAFQIYDKVRFERDILPRYFGASQHGSFVRQLYLYNFTKITAGPDIGAHFHEQLLRGRPDLAMAIERRPSPNANKPREIVIAPDFSELPRCGEDCSEATSSRLTTRTLVVKGSQKCSSLGLAANPKTSTGLKKRFKKNAGNSYEALNKLCQTYGGDACLAADGIKNRGSNSLSPLRKFHFENMSVCEIGLEVNADSYFVFAPPHPHAGAHGP